MPSRESTGVARPDETVGTGDNSTTKFYLDNSYIVNSTYTLRYSAAETTPGTALTDTTHYVLTKDNGKIVLTSAGVTLIGTNNIYAEYSYCLLSLTDTMLQDALNRAQVEIDNITDTHFATATDTTPDYTQETNEKHDGEGRYDRAYSTLKYPLPNVSTTVSGTAIVADDTTVYVASTTGFLSAGVIGVGSDKITYTSKTTTSFTGCTGTDAAHATAVDVKPYVVEICTTAPGCTPTWQILTEVSEFDIDRDTGRVFVYRQDYYIDEMSYANPPRHIPNRFRLTYMYGHDTIPADIKRCCLMLAAKDLLHTVVRNKHLLGVNDFSPEMIDIDEAWIKATLENYSSIQSAAI